MAVFPSDNKVIIPKLIYGDQITTSDTGMKEYTSTLAENKKILLEAGFELIEIPMTWDMIEYKALTNSDVITGEQKTTIIMPSFGETEIEKTTKDILEAKGLSVNFIKNESYQEGHGNSHCLTGALAANEKTQSTSLI